MNKRIRLIITTLALTAAMIVPSFSVSADENQRWNLGSAQKTSKDSGYTGEKPIDLDDPHYGWNLGQFYVSGYTQRTTDSDADVFLKNVGDQVELHFELLQDIDCLNGDSNLSICEDNNGYDQYFGTQQFNNCRGLLIIRKTDYQNSSSDPVIYTNYLTGVSQGADTVVELCEEGDYEVALDYEIKEDHYGVNWNTLVSVPTYTNYRIFFKFKIRNGNCMIFPFDSATGSELTNESFTENGFYLDLANSRYLDINVQRSVYVENANGYTEDIRFNRPASDGTQYTDEGVYTITVKNNYTNQETVKTIYVGTDPTMRAFVVSGYSLEDIKEMLDEGYTISDSGDMIPPEVEDEQTEETIQETEEQIEIEPETVPSEPTTEDETEAEKPKKGKGGILVLFLGIAVAVVVFFALKNKKPNLHFDTQSNDSNMNETVEPVAEESVSEEPVVEESISEEQTVENSESLKEGKEE